MFFSKKMKLFILIILVLTLVSIPSICAKDLKNTTVEQNQVTTTDNFSQDENATGTFNELKKDILSLSPGDVYNMNKNYIFEANKLNGLKSNLPNNGIKLSTDNVTINGNGHFIDGNHKGALFTVTGNNVKITNLTLINFKYNGLNFPVRYDKNIDGESNLTVNYIFDTSPICWMGDNGLIDSCVFFNNSAINGGAITWMGYNGTIKNNKFINNTARGIGGAIYIMGQNNKVINSTFNNSKSRFSGEAIFIDRICKIFNLSSTFYKCKPYINGAQTGIDVDYLCYQYHALMSDSAVNLIDILYSSIINNYTHYLGNNILYFSAYNGTDFQLNFARSYDDVGIIYGKTYHFTNIHNYNEVFEALVKDNFKIEMTFIKKMMVYNINDYEKAMTIDDSIFLVDTFTKTIQDDLKSVLTKSYSIFDELVITFGGHYTFNSKSMWKPSNTFNMIIINGNGTTISGSSSRTDEYVWAQLKDTSCIFCVNDLTIDGFNMGIENLAGTCILNNVKFNNNQMDWLVYQDYGAGICNTGTCFCNNCVFTNNYCKHGGAIFSQGHLEVNNCIFNNNHAYGKGNDICIADEGILKMDDVKINCNRDHVEFVKSLTKKERTIIAVVAPVLAALVGVFVGAICGCPQLGLIFGAIAGSCVGVVAAKYVCSHTYDLTFNRAGFCMLIIAECALAGAIGGAIGGSLTAGTEVAADTESCISYGSSDVSSVSSGELNQLSGEELKYVEWLKNEPI